MRLTFSNLYKHTQYLCKLSPNNYYLANVIDERLVIRRLQPPELEVLQVFEMRYPIDYIAWSPNSEYIAAVSLEKSCIDVRSVHDAAYKGTLKDEGFSLHRIRWSCDSNSIVCISKLKLRIAIWNLLTQDAKYMDHIKVDNKGIENSPDSRWTAVVQKIDGKDCISLYNADFNYLFQSFEVDTVDLEDLKWSPSSMYIAAWDNCLYYKLLIYRVDGAICRIYEGDGPSSLGIKCVNWSPNNRFLAVGNYDGTVHLLSTDTWDLITKLKHPSSISAKLNIVNKLTLCSYSNFLDKYVQKRPYHLSIRRPDYNEPNPKIGIGGCYFSPDSYYLCTKNDSMPNAIWIWEVNTLTCLHLLIFKSNVRQMIWNPNEEHILVVICGDENIHFVSLEKRSREIELNLIKAPTKDFLVKKACWSKNGESLLLMDQQLFCMASGQ
ncbi:WD40-repeat-containing domain protein [Mycotypha africana]|uniref:WD40-repeat-containing domain protein n=1 Tax=Mycotypha africana TaxID=64632 RepID=UPI002301EA3A|nr:WD40-repeat-containing domain protein [Mycotypha africana]KAI8982449.1 WD40-repeat-containing domain protein [Mycotypha africana]